MVDTTPGTAPGRRQVRAEDWVDAAEQAFVTAGLGAIRVEVLARTLGVTKGSFYWHFTDRRTLVDAVIRRWETAHTDAMIAESERGADPADKIRRLIGAVSADRGDGSGEQLLYVDAEREGVQGAVDRVTDRRLDYLSGLLVELGIERAEAERRATLALAAAIGMQQLRIGAPAAVRRKSLAHGQFTTFLYRTLVDG